MKIFVSYARRDRQAVDFLLQDMRRARHEVWVDEELTGGQAWWDTILATIRGTDVFVLALSPDLLKSRACQAEYQYALACNRTILPVMVAPVSPQMAPPAIANAQILDYVERTPNAAINLVTALAAAQPSPPPPDPPPSPPPVPMSYMNRYREQL
ncbi:MAG TPA: toll/interleukin-1 receptor domain-containing protein, partial [Ilumatobacter sp.]|nr:toll/interleukin-1 receptor domain-containing protein [Ilumatobacter sp.]